MTTKTSLPQSFTLADLSGRRTLVTGAGRGLGRALAGMLTDRGYAVHVTDVDLAAAKAAAAPDRVVMRNDGGQFT